MSKISTYEVTPVPKLADKLIGTSVGGEIEDITYNFTLSELLNLFIPNIPANTLQGVLDYGNEATQDIILHGTIYTTNLEVSGSINLVDTYLNGETHILGGLYDSLDSAGTAGQVLRSTGEGVEWYTIPTIIPTLQQVLASGNTADINIVLSANIQAATASANNVVANTSLSVVGNLKDKDASTGTAGQVLSSTGTKVQWIDLPIYAATSPLHIDNITKTISIQQANSTQDGYLSSADWITFSGKQDAISLTTVGSSGPATLVGTTINVPNYTLSGLGGVPLSRTLTINGITYNLSADRTWSIPTGVSAVSATSPLFSTGGENPNISIQQAGSSLDGYLSSADWITFNDKQPAGNYITSLTGEASGVGPGAASVVISNSAVIGKLLTGLNITGGTISDTDSILTAFGKVQNQINSLVGGVIYKGVWNAGTNDPYLTSSVGVQGNYYIVNVAGSTNLNGITDWQVGDWAIFSGSVWNKVDNTDAVTSVNGQTGAVSLTTDNIPEGTTNLYFLNSRARAALSFAAGSGAYNSTTGVITIPTNTNQLTNGAGFITLGSLSASAPLSYNSLSGVFGIQVANSSQDGYLSSTDWNTFNNKQNYLGGSGLVKSTAGSITYINDNSTNWNTAYDNMIVSAAVTGASTKTLTLTQQDAGTITASWTDNGLTSVGVSMPSAFSVANSPLTSNGTIAVTGAGTALQYIDGTGALQTFPAIANEAATLVTEVYNETGATLTKGTVVYINGGHGNLPTVTKALATSDATSAQTYGVVQVDISNMSSGHVVVIGSLGDLDTRNYPNGTQLYLSSTTAGAWTDVKQYAPAHLVYVGIVVRQHPTQGVVEIKIQNGFEMDELHNVAAQNPNNNSILQYKTSTSLWTSVDGTTTNIAEGSNLYYLDSRARAALSITTLGTSGPATYNSTTGVFNIPNYGSALTGYVPYTGASSNVNLGVYNLTAASLIKSGGTSSQFLKADGSIDSSAYIVLGSLSASAPLSYNSSTGAFSISQASATTDGYLSSADWNTFNSKQPAGNYVPTSRTLNINGTSYDLSTDRSWSVGTVTSVAALTLGTAGTDLNSSVATGSTTPVITLNVPTASAVNRGALSAADWSTFNTKVSGVTASSPLSSSGGQTPNITIQVASGTQNGYLSSTDWTTFNNKQAAGNYITSLTGEATASGPGAASVTLSNSAVTAKVLTGINITGGTVLATDSILTGFGKLQNQINGLIGSTIYQGTWNANTNTPTLTSSVGTRGYYYIVNVAGTTNLNGITDWQVGDWAIFDGTAWQKVDNTDAVSSVNGQTGAVSLTTDNIPEGSTNLYFTNARARASLSFAAGSGAYNSTTGVITIPTNTNQLTNGASFITLASLSGSAPIQYNNTTGAISITQAGASSNGFLSSTDWNTFNNKQVAGNYVTTDTVQTITALKTFTAKVTINTGGTDDQIQLVGVAPSVRLSNAVTGATINGFIAMAGAANNYIQGAVAGDMTIGNQNNGKILFGFGSGTATQKMSLDSSGNVVFAGNITLSTSLSNGTYTYTLPGATGTLALTSQIPSLAGYIQGSGTANYMPKFTGTSTIGNSNLVDVNGYLVLGATASTYGQAGRGTFEMNGSADNIFAMKVAGSLAAYLYSTASNTELYSTTQLQLSTGGNVRVTVTSGGNFGIATTTPSYTLDVNGTGRFTGLLTVDGGNLTLTGGYRYLNFNYTANTSSRIWRLSNDQVAYGDFVLQQNTTQTGSTFSNILYFSPSGAATFSSSVSVNTLISTNDVTTSSGQGRFGGWYTGTGYTGTAVEAGVTGGAGNIIVYNRQSGTYQSLYIAGSNLYLRQQGGLIYINSQLVRESAGIGWLSGNYASSETSSTTGAIYSIGGSYYPTGTLLNTMYGIGYTNSAQGQMPSGASDWGMYVAGGGVARIWLESLTGKIIATGDIYANTSSLVATQSWVSTNYALKNGSTSNQFYVFEVSYAPTNFNPSTGPRTALDPMSVKMWNNYFNGTGLGSDYGIVMDYYGLGGHVNTQVYFDAGGGSWYRTAYYNSPFGSWQKYVTENGGTWNISISGSAGSVGGVVLNRIVYGDNSTATTYIAEAGVQTALKSGFYTVGNSGSGYIPTPTSVNFLMHTAYYGEGNLAGFDLLANDSTSSNLYFRPATGGGKGAWQTILTNNNYNSYAPTLTGGGASGTWGISITGSSGTSNQANAAYLVNGTSGGAIQSWDVRTIAPASMNAYRMGFGFTSWANNNTSPYADYIHLRSYSDSSGGADNLLMFLKSGFGIRIYQQAFGSGTAYSSYKDVAWTDGTNASGTWGISISGNAGNTSSISNATGGTYTWTGLNYFYSNLGGYCGSLANPPLQVYTTGANSAFMSFHRSGQYAVNMGLDADNVLRIGGWSASANRWQLDMSGNNTIPGFISANAHFDGPLATNRYGASSGVTAGRVYGPSGASYSFAGGNITGAIKIRLPFRANDLMWSMKVRIYNYNTNQTSEYLIGNYSYNNGGWNSSATFIGGQNAVPQIVRFGNDGSYDCVWIGDTSYTWSYPVVSVMDITGGFSNGSVSNYYQNWDISLVGAFGTVQTTVSPDARFSSTFASYYYDASNSGYFINSSGTSTMNSIRMFGKIRYGSSVADDSGFGMYFDDGLSTAYAIYREAGSWSYPYPDLRIAFHTGISLGANPSYGGIRFFSDYDMSTVVLYVNNGSYGGGGNVYATGSITATAFYESSDIRLKTILEDNARVKGIENIKPKLYEKNGKKEFGYIAQDFLEVMPYSLTQNNAEGFYSLVYREVHTAKIATIEDSIEDLKAKILYLENQLKQKQ